MKTKNKVFLIIGICILLFFLTSISAYFIVKKINKNNEYAVTDNCIYEENMYEMGDIEENDAEVSSTTEKVSPNAFLIIKKKYNECGHTTEENVELPNEMVNKTQEEIEDTYKDFTLESFSQNEVVLFKEVEGKCNEHYKIKEEDGVIVIYNTNENGEEVLYDKTGISVEYLTDSDVESIRNGLEIYGKQNLNKFIEDFE